MHYNFLKVILSFYKDLSIKNKLFLLFFIQIIIPVIFIGYINYNKSSEVIKDKSIAYSQDILNMIEVRLEDTNENLDSLSLDLLFDQRVYDVLNYRGSEEERLNYYNNVSDVYNILRKTALSRPDIQSICFISSKMDIYCFDNDISFANIKQIMPYEKLLMNARLANGKLCWYLDKTTNMQNIYVTRLINNRDSFNEIGLLVILIKKEYLQSIYQDLLSDSLKNVSIVSNNEDIISTKNTEYSYLIGDFFKRGLQNKRGFYIDNKNNMLVNYVPIEKLNWTILSFISLKDLYKEIDVLKISNILMVILSFFILSILSLATSFDIVEPLNKLVSGMKKVEKGESHEDILLNRSDELGYLSKSFNKMSKKIDYLINTIYKEQITRKEAELKSLQAQINPHFLFNTLESINWMAQLNGVPKISETVTALATIIDASIGRDNKLICISEELNYINNYIAIIKNRYGDKLSFICEDIDNTLLNTKIPKLLIQPLIENAVYHGIENVTRNGIIELKLYADNFIVIEIIDNGIGIKEDELLFLNKKLSLGDSLSYQDNNERKSIGIENVNRRIKLFYGEGYGLIIESKYDEYTKVKVTIPKESL